MGRQIQVNKQLRLY